MITKIISHRGNLYGPHAASENRIDQINEAKFYGFDVEVDLFNIDNDFRFYLGHDTQQEHVWIGYLVENKNRFIYHCKNLRTLIALTDFKTELHYFYHAKDDACVTSQGFAWIHPQTLPRLKSSKIITKTTNPFRAIAVMPELYLDMKDDTKEFLQNFYGVCTDYSYLYKDFLENE